MTHMWFLSSMCLYVTIQIWLFCEELPTYAPHMLSRYRSNFCIDFGTLFFTLHLLIELCHTCSVQVPM